MANHQADPLVRRRPRRSALLLTYVILAGAAVLVMTLGMWVVSGRGAWWMAATWLVRSLYLLFAVLLVVAVRRRRTVCGRHAPGSRPGAAR